ncbi:MBL fold metallo-hydrolase [uncultured Cohaesibacter sp.]|uniref:MBL fold metallo-hydrolase n=1 Tax=uncultured Cohaesibacter sp. TaxID=1002546 RepID=UPI00292D4ECA|nr:MBL fold metallo-hydrolase [uncultured Cohaesibacter sp.]
MTKLHFDTAFSPNHGKAISLGPGVRRLTCNNPSPFTFHGTNSYIVGEGHVAVIDPGPDDETHIAALIEATRGETISHILITHSHVDHSAGARRLRKICKAPIFAEGPHRPARDLHQDERNPLDAEGDADLVIDEIVGDGTLIKGNGWTLEALHTPGHTVNHLAFAFPDETGLFSGDHVMAWSTTIVAPPDGSMHAYMDSLERLMERNDAVYWPGHGGVISDPTPFLAGLRAHRQSREQALIARLEAGEETIPEMVATVYKDVDRSLHGAAALSMFAQMEYLLARGLVVCLDETATMTARYRLA